MANLKDFSATSDAPESGSFGPVPEGHYLARLTESTESPTKAGNGTVVKLVWELVEGSYNKRTIWEWVLTSHPNETAMDIAHKTWNKIAHATARTQAKDTRDFHNIPVWLFLKVDGEKNVVKGYDPQNAKPAESAPVAESQSPKQTWDSKDESIPF